MSNEKIAEFLGLSPIEVVDQETGEVTLVPGKHTEIDVPVTPSTAAQEVLIDDIEQAKSNMSAIIEGGGAALKDLFALAKLSQSSKEFEAASSLIKSLVDANREFVSLAEKRKFAKEEQSTTQESVTNVTNNNLIISTTEMLKMLKGESK